MAATMKLKLITLAGTQLERDVYEVTVPTVDGEIGVFPDHEPLVTLAKTGAVKVRYAKSDTDVDFFAISGGIVRIDGQELTILVDEADHSDDIIEAESQKALERAKELKANAKDSVELEKASAMIDRHQVRLKVADLRRHRRNRP